MIVRRALYGNKAAAIAAFFAGTFRLNSIHPHSEATMAETGEKRATRKCWECLQRRLVCDKTLPRCNKCQKRGGQCSGYDDAKPLQWVQPGMVTSKRRRKKDGSSRKRSSDNTAAETEVDYACEPVNYEAALAEWVKDRIANPQYRVTDLHVLSFKMIAVAREAARVFEIGGRIKIEQIVQKGLHEEATRVLRSGRDPLQRLQRLLAFLSMQDVPLYDDLMDETSEVIQAVQYCEWLSLSPRNMGRALKRHA